MHLSPREQDVFRLASQGFTTRYIATRLGLSPRTVEVHIRHIYEKCGVANRDQLIELKWQTTLLRDTPQAEDSLSMHSSVPARHA